MNSLSTCMVASRYIFPARKERSVTGMLQSEEALNTRIGQEIRDRLIDHPNESGVHPLRQAHDAFVSRALLAQTADWPSATHAQPILILTAD